MYASNLARDATNNVHARNEGNCRVGAPEQRPLTDPLTGLDDAVLAIVSECGGLGDAGDN